MTMKLRLQQAIQENEYYFRGFVRMADLAELFREYPFEEETLGEGCHTQTQYGAWHIFLYRYASRHAGYGPDDRGGRPVF